MMSAFSKILPVGLLLCLLASMIAVEPAAAQTVNVDPSLKGLRGSADLSKNAEPPRLSQVEETDRRRLRNYPEQPPTIPHSIEGYQLDKNGNQCLSCHARSRVAESGAPMVSVSHFMDRDGQTLATVSPRRYFCNQCHVIQNRVPEPIKNTFVDIDALLAVEAAN